MSALDGEGVDHEPDMDIAWMIGVSVLELVCYVTSASEKFLAHVVDVDFDGDIFAISVAPTVERKFRYKSNLPQNHVSTYAL